MGQQVGRVGEAPGLQQSQPRGIRGSSAARPSGRRRDLVGRTAEAGFNIFTQHGECPGAGVRAWGRPEVELGRGGRQTGSPRGSSGWRGAREWGRNRLPSGPVTGGESHPSPLPSPAWLAAPGGGGGKRSGLRDLGWTVVYTGHDCAARGSGGTVHGILRGEETEARCELNPGVSLNRLLARGP